LSNFSNFLFVFSKAKPYNFLAMFLGTNNLNEGGCRDKCFGGRKRELQEGKNPKTVQEIQTAESGAKHVNAHWQKLRK